MTQVLLYFCLTSCSNSGGTVNFGCGEKSDWTEVSSRGLFADLAGVVNREEVAGVDAADIDLLAVGIGIKSDLGFNESSTGWAQPGYRLVLSVRIIMIYNTILEMCLQF